MERPKFWLIIDGQWGSTGKGLIAGYLAQNWDPDGVVCNFGPNAGHTFIDDLGEVMTRQLPTAAVVGSYINKIFIGPGAIIDVDVLIDEIKRYESFLDGKQIFLHSGAAVVLPEHRELEKANLNGISSTLKGTGASMAAKTMRMRGSCLRMADSLVLNRLKELDGVKIINHMEYLKELTSCKRVQVESAQGMELSVAISGFYPYTTGRDITPAQIIADCGLPTRMNMEIIATMRTFPIRVGNAYSEGKQVGWSGPVHSDQKELFWSDLGVEPETTTVTKKIRRVFTHSDINMVRIMQIIQPDYVFVNFMNYIKCLETRKQYISKLVDELKLPVRWLGYGPKTTDIYEMNIGIDFIP